MRGIFLGRTRAILEKNKVSQVSEFAYAISAVIGGRDVSDAGVIQAQLDSLGKTPSLEFMVLTDPSMHIIASYVAVPQQWNSYQEQLGDRDRWMSNGLGQVRQLTRGQHSSYVMTVPLFRTAGKDDAPDVYGYLHVSSSGDDEVAQLRYLQVFVLLTCMAVVLAGVADRGADCPTHHGADPATRRRGARACQWRPLAPR